MKRFNMILNIAIIIVLMCSASWADTYYIDNADGNDNNSGSQSTPWKTIGKANSALQAGDTVYIAKGTYKETIRPSRSGEKGSYITYSRKGNDKVIITGVSDGVNLADRSYIVIDGIHILEVSGEWIDLRPNGSHNIVQNCYMEESESYKGVQIRDGANYNKILNNTMIGYCGPDDLIQIWNSNHNLIDGNKMYYGPHDAIDIQDRIDGSTSYNIIRNNYIQNWWHSNLNIIAVENILVENNFIADGGENSSENYCGSDRDRSMDRVEHKGIGLQAKNAIVRNNISVRNGYGVAPTSGDGSDPYPWKNPCGDNRIYSNVLTQNYSGIRRNDTDPLISNPTYFKNNILYKNTNYEIDIYAPTDPENSIYIINNNIYGGSNKFDNSKYVVMENISTNPLFVDEENRNYHLQSKSPMIDAGTWLTKITSKSGTGTTFTVEDSGYFMDGWGIINGDIIQLQGTKKTARIKSIDHKTNTITVDTVLSWNMGYGISLPYSGISPDLGAFEFNDEQQDSNIVEAPVNLRVIAF